LSKRGLLAVGIFPFERQDVLGWRLVAALAGEAAAEENVMPILHKPEIQSLESRGGFSPSYRSAELAPQSPRDLV